MQRNGKRPKCGIMQEYTSQFEYKSELTEDGSPTLRLPPTWEPMHALDGAYTETLYIYRPTVEQALKTAKPARIISIGLGLGYNEILVAAEALKAGADRVFIDSYESVPELREYFQKWICKESSPLDSIYDTIVSLYANTYGIQATSLRKFLHDKWTTEELRLYSAITPQTQFQQSQGILFDAFSSKSSPELWDEDFLNRFADTAAGPTCFLSTYASKGTLHRALRSHGFITEKRAGFGKKRESTFAQKSIN